MNPILLVDDEERVLRSLEKLLGAEGYPVVTAMRADEALQKFDELRPSVVVTDVRLPDLTGIELFARVRARSPRTPVIVMTAFGTTDLAIEASERGAFDFHAKPFDPADMLRSVKSATESTRLMREELQINPAETPTSGDALVGRGRAMQAVYRAIGKVAPTDATVLIRGETGTGKELVARAIYRHSLRSKQPLVVVNCTAIPETLLESELYGFERGAFTGAVSRRVGKFELARSGTIFLDEIGDVSLSVQAKLLRVLEDRTFEPLGGSRVIDAQVRVLAATNRDLEQSVEAGQFRGDLYHRLNIFVLRLPPLREMREDIPLLVDYHLKKIAHQLQVEPPPIAEEAVRALQAARWPGNVRELRNCLERLVIDHGAGPIGAPEVARTLGGKPEAGPAPPPPEPDLREIVRRYVETAPAGQAHVRLVESVEQCLLEEALRKTERNRSSAARFLGLSRPTLLAKLRKYGL